MSTAGKHRELRARPTPRAGVSSKLFYGMFAVLFATNAATGLAFYMSGDLTRILGEQNTSVISAYEDRLSQMRVEIDRLHSRVYAQAGDINMQLQEVVQQQDVLLEQQQLVRALVDKAGQMGIASLPVPSLPTLGDPTDLLATTDALNLMLTETDAVMTSIADTASSRTETIASELNSLGIYPGQLSSDLSIGGPLLPAASGPESRDMLITANHVMSALLRYNTARTSLEQAPVHLPLAENSYRQSSGFGNRSDPFTRAPAFHSGLDFAAPTGTTVLAAGEGRVIFVGSKSGYGKTVEIEHPSGLLSRYSHLSAYLVEIGQDVSTGLPIAKVGSTGRSTGPHLHFEVRKGDQALNPKRFLDVGNRLRAQLG